MYNNNGHMVIDAIKITIMILLVITKTITILIKLIIISKN